MGLELEDLLKNKNATATLILPPMFNLNGSDGYGGRPPRIIQGIVSNATFDIGGSNTFSVPFDAQGSLDSAQAMMTLSNIAQSKGSGKPIVQKQLTSGFNTTKVWQSSEDFTFQLDLTFVATRSSDEGGIDNVSGTNNVLAPCIELLSMVYPSSVGDQLGALNVFTYTAPNGYSIGDLYNPLKTEIEQEVTGVVQIAIGNWLRLRNMVCNSVGCSFSREIQKNGTPLYATVSMGFSSFHTFMYNDIVGIFNSSMKVDIIKEIQNIAIKQSNAPVQQKGLPEEVIKKITDAGKNLLPNQQKGS